MPTLMERIAKPPVEHISQHHAQLGEASSIEVVKMHLFSLSLTATVFLSWFSSLAPNCIYAWEQYIRASISRTFIMELMN